MVSYRFSKVITLPNQHLVEYDDTRIWLAPLEYIEFASLEEGFTKID